MRGAGKKEIRMPASDNKKYGLVFWLTLSGVVLVAAAYFPAVLKAAYQVGLLPAGKVGDVTITMNEEWFPALNSQSGIGRILLRTTRPTVVFAETRGLAPGYGSLLTVSIDQSPFDNPEEGLVAFSREYSWGTAKFIRHTVTNTPDERIVRVSQYNLNVSATDRVSLEKALPQIKKIETERK